MLHIKNWMDSDVLVSICCECILATVLENFVSLHQLCLKFDCTVSQSVHIGCIQTNSMVTVPGDLNVTLAFGFTEVLFGLSLVGLFEVFTVTLCCPLESLPARLVKKFLLLGVQGTGHRFISCNDTQRFIGCLPILQILCSDPL